ncbi:hypothetical protein [Microbulbifer guangxiensis]|uniref:hypothetical protein n=1 Tax=Microbulbifer guangxiensis TaxID=2904249 RepID=UPI001F3BB3C9|nr:hypothetical protein [Microbulbifer guangxiensis]
MAVEQVLVSWFGGKDLAAVQQGWQQLEPVAQTLASQCFDRVELLHNYPQLDVVPYLEWLVVRSLAAATATNCSLSSPVNFGEIHQAAEAVLSRLAQKLATERHILLSPGTPAIQTVWILLGKTRFPFTFWRSSLEDCVSRVEIPFEIVTEYVPRVGNVGSWGISGMASASAPINASYPEIITQNPQMERLKGQVAIQAERKVFSLL